MRAELVLESRAQLGEGPSWDAEARELIWVDIPAGAIHRFDPVTGEDREFAVGQPVGAAVPRAGGGLMLALQEGFAGVDDDGGLEWVARVEADRAEMRMNDGACDAAGRFWAGTMPLDERDPVGSLYKLSPDGTVERMLAGVTISNGIGWSPDNSVMYYIDTPRRCLEAFDFDLDQGAISGRRVVVSFAPEAGSPDGLTVDADGYVWIAFWGGAAVRGYSPSGELAAIVELPVSQPTSCAFGGPELDTLYITSARRGTDPAREPTAGGLFRARPGSRGLRAQAFAG